MPHRGNMASWRRKEPISQPRYVFAQPKNISVMIRPIRDGSRQQSLLYFCNSATLLARLQQTVQLLPLVNSYFFSLTFFSSILKCSSYTLFLPMVLILFFLFPLYRYVRKKIYGECHFSKRTESPYQTMGPLNR